MENKKIREQLHMELKRQAKRREAPLLRTKGSLELLSIGGQQSPETGYSEALNRGFSLSET